MAKGTPGNSPNTGTDTSGGNRINMPGKTHEIENGGDGEKNGSPNQVNKAYKPPVTKRQSKRNLHHNIDNKDLDIGEQNGEKDGKAVLTKETPVNGSHESKGLTSTRDGLPKKSTKSDNKSEERQNGSPATKENVARNEVKPHPSLVHKDSVNSIQSKKFVHQDSTQSLCSTWSGTGSDDGDSTTGMVTMGKTGRKGAFSGKSTLPRSNTLSSGVPSESMPGEDDDTINVVVRVRPLVNQESARNEKPSIQFPGDGALWIDTGVITKSFTFNVTFEPEASQQDVFDHSGMKKLIEMALNGYSCTAFAFGQTGSGKTHTITGPPELFQEGSQVDPDLHGVVPRSFHYLFKQMNENPGNGYRITASYLEIYNEQVIDLLNPNQAASLPVRWSKNKGFYVENLFVVECETMDDLLAVLEEGLQNRQTGSNSVNEHSSRSHSMLTLQLDSETQDPEDENVYITKRGKLTFVDLAGSEKTKSDGVSSAEHMAESNNINKSLLVLGNCISALGDSKRRQGHIPYRDSKLTKLLADSLGGNGVTLMIACVSPATANSSESMNTLRYANRAKKIKTKPVIKMDPREKLIMSLKREIKVLRQENHYLRQQLEFPVKPRGQLQKDNDAKFLQLMKDTQKDGQKNVTDHGLYEMLQEYMIENETLRSENSDLHQVRDQTRRDQQLLARENEKLSQKLDHLEKERVSMQTPLTVYSINSTPVVSRRSSVLSDLRQNSPYYWTQGPPQPPYIADQYSQQWSPSAWASSRQAENTVDPSSTSSNNLHPMIPYQSGSPQSGAGSQSPRKGPPAHLQYPTKPPHRLQDSVHKSPGYSESPRNVPLPPQGYTSRLQKQQEYYERNPPVPVAGSYVTHSLPPGVAQPPPQEGPAPRSGPYPGYRPPDGGGNVNSQPVPSPRKSKGQGYSNQQGAAPTHSPAAQPESESLQDMNTRLRQELLDLEGQIKQQSRISQQGTTPAR